MFSRPQSMSLEGTIHAISRIPVEVLIFKHGGGRVTEEEASEKMLEVVRMMHIEDEAETDIEMTAREVGVEAASISSGGAHDQCQV